MLRNGLDAFAAAIGSMSLGAGPFHFRVTEPKRICQPVAGPSLGQSGVKNTQKIPLEIIGTDAASDLRAGNADVAIRYARRMPSDLAAT